MKEKSIVTEKKVKEAIKALGLVEEYQESSLETFVGRFRDMDLAVANSIVQSIILNTNYIEMIAEEHLIELAPLFPYRSKEDVKAKLIRVESIRVAVAILIIFENNSTKVHKDWSMILPMIEIFKEVYPFDLDIRLEAILDYLKRE